MFSFLKKKKKKIDNGNYASITVSSGLDETYLFDFKNLGSLYNGSSGVFTSGFISIGDPTGVEDNTETPSDSSQVTQYKSPQKIKVKPKDVLDELERIPTPFSLLGIDEKISILKDKQALIAKNDYSKRDVQALIQRMENRRHFLKHKAFFDDFANTTDEKIDKLLSKYDLVMKTSDIFIPEFPDDAIAVMKAYTEKCKLICDKKPVFYVIAEESKFRKAFEKRDPILLVQSPFGFFWQILGAWDEEMLLLGEL